MSNFTDVSTNFTSDFKITPVKKYTEEELLEKHNIKQADTDSNYLCLDPLLEKLNKVDDFVFIEKLYDKIIEPKIKDAVQQVSETLNFMQDVIIYEREKITKSFISLAPKRYFYHNQVTYKILEKAYLGETGVDAIGKSTPPVAKVILKEVMDYILYNDQSKLEHFVYSKRDSYNVEDNKLTDLCEIKGVSDIVSWFYDELSNKVVKFKDDGVTKQTAQSHARGAYLYNLLMKEHGLDNDYDLIENNDKVYVAFVHPSPELYNTDVISFKDEEVVRKLGFQFDTPRMFDKYVLNKINLLIKPLEWVIRNPNEGLDNFF